MLKLPRLLIFLLLIFWAKCSPAKFEQKEELKSKCGYQSCRPTREGHVNVHLIPHSHDDVGWVKTVDQFYYGTNQKVYQAGVVNIYDDVLKAIEKNENRRFIYVETAFFWKWWQEQEEKERQRLRNLVNNGRIEFIGGGWSMNDEAVTHYQSIIDQMAWGLKKLNDTFGECGRPKIGWQIDPFGHSSEMASIFAHLGYDGNFVARIDFQDRDNRIHNKSMDMVWRGSNSLGRPSDIFTSVLYKDYYPPTGFCFDVLCDDENLVDDIKSPEYNIDVKAKEFILKYAQEEFRSYQTRNLIIPMGRDFSYQEAEVWFKNMDKLIKYINKVELFNGTKYHLLYSTPSCYAAAVHKESNGVLTSPLKTDDFFPYASEGVNYWTGYFTSRPTLKRFERMGNNFLQVCKQLYALTNLSSRYERGLDSLREAMGILQHHDAITGTEKELVAYDYARLLDIGFKNCENITNQALTKLTNSNHGRFETCLLVNVSQCAFSERSKVFVVTVYNPLSREVDKYVRLPVLGTAYTVIGPDGNKINTQIIPIARRVQKIKGRQSDATVELIFKASNLPPLGYKSYFITRNEGDDVTREDQSQFYSYSKSAGISFDIDPNTGLINKMNMNHISLDIDQRFYYYNGSGSMDDYMMRCSGAYIFRPDREYPIKKVSDTARFKVYKGDIVTEVHQIFNEFVSQVVRIYDKENYIELDWVIGPLELSDGSNGKEVITRFTTPIKSNSTFYTDSNGRELVQRIRNFRPTWDFASNETETPNYYPVTSKILIRDEKKNIEFAVLTDRAQGGSSLQDGEIELMLHRNAATDEELGVDEALREVAFGSPIIVRGSHYVVFGHIANTTPTDQSVAAIEHKIAEQKLLDSWIFLSSTKTSTFDDFKKSHSMEFSGLASALPENVHIMTLEPWNGNSYLLRLEHTFEKNEDPLLSNAVSVNLRNLFTTFEIKSLKETTLGGNQWLKDSQRLNFKSAYQADGGETQKVPNGDYDEQTSDFMVSLEPMQIRTFIIDVSPKSIINKQ